MTLLLFAHFQVDAIIKILDFFYLHSDVHISFYAFMFFFSSCSVNPIVKITFSHFMACNEYSVRENSS